MMQLTTPGVYDNHFLNWDCAEAYCSLLSIKCIVADMRPPFQVVQPKGLIFTVSTCGTQGDILTLRLCEIIRNHLANLNKYKDQRDRPDLSTPENLQLYMDTTFRTLKIATDLTLWKEASRSAEDIHGLMCMVHDSPKASLMVIYYAKLTEIFLIADRDILDC